MYKYVYMYHWQLRLLAHITVQLMCFVVYFRQPGINLQEFYTH